MKEFLQARQALTTPTLVERARHVLAGGVLGTSTMPDELAVVPVAARGAHVITEDGRTFVDYTMGSGVHLLGYAPAVVEGALREQAAMLVHAYGYLNEPAIALAEEIVELVPSAECVRFAASGGEATFYALRLARAATRRDLVLKFEGAYHGFHDYAIQSFARGRGGDYPKPLPGSSGIPAAVSEQVLVAPFNDLDQTEAIVRGVAERLAAVIVEPVQRAILPEPGFLEGLRELCDEVGACLVFDEIVTAFRLGLGGAQERYGVLPDLTTLGKIVGGGLPLAAVCGRADIVERAAPGSGDVYQSGTMNGHALAAACGLALLRELRRDPPYARLTAIGDELRSRLAALLDEHDAPAQVIGTDSLWQVLFTDRQVRSAADIWAADSRRLLAFHDGLLARGVLVWRGNRSFISTAHTADDLDLTLAAAADALADLAAATTKGS
jgi:glutamate-1-semialdehyde 2,1-aminomutase